MIKKKSDTNYLKPASWDPLKTFKSNHVSPCTDEEAKKRVCSLIFLIVTNLTWLSYFTFTVHFHALEKEMAAHSRVLAWRIPGTGEPGGLPSMGSHRVGHDWSNLAAAAMTTAFSMRECNGVEREQNLESVGLLLMAAMSRVEWGAP